MNLKEMTKGIKEGDKNAFKALFDLYYPSLCAFMRSYTNDMDSAEEIAQKTFFMLWQKRKKLDVHTSIKGYLYTMARNNFLQIQKQRKKQNLLLEELKYKVIQEEMNRDEEMQEKKIDQLKIIIEELPPRCKEILLLKQKGLKYSEIAEKLDLSIKTVESQMRIAFTKIKEGFKNSSIFLFMVSRWLR